MQARSYSYPAGSSPQHLLQKMCDPAGVPAYGPFCDIGANLLDGMFRGEYHSHRRHPNDFNDMMDRAHAAGVKRIIITAGSYAESREALEMARNTRHDVELYSTVGVHPTRANEFRGNSEQVVSDLAETLRDGMSDKKVAAVGECGLDYDRTKFCGKEQQMSGFLAQFALAEQTGLPMFLHDRNTGEDFLNVLREHRDQMRGGGVIHSYTGPMELMESYVDLGLYIGINGCSLKTEANLAVAAAVPEDLLLLETDAPWCSIRNSHASSQHVKTRWRSKPNDRWAKGFTVKDRCEPCHIVQVLEVLAEIRGVDPHELAEKVYQNTNRLFFSNVESST